MKINREKMAAIGAAVEHRNALRELIRKAYSNEALATRFRVNLRTIERLAALHKEQS